MAGPDLPPLLHLTADEVRAAMPPLDERLRLAELTMTSLATPGAAELPPKIAVHPRPEGSFAHAMPAHLRATSGAPDVAPDGAPDRVAGPAGTDLLGMKWVAGFAGNRARGLPAIHALVIVNDPATGVPLAILDGGPITAERTAAVSGVAIRHFAPNLGGRPARVGIVGAGVQGHSHLAVVGRLLEGADLQVFDRHPERAAELARSADATEGIASARTVERAEDAAAGADVVVTATAFTTPERRQAMTPEWLEPHALVVPVDYATFCSAAVASGADLFLVDERGQFLANRDAGQFDGYPDPTATLGEAILARTPRPPGRVVVTHLGVGLADVVFGAAILERAGAAGLGRALPR